MPPDLDLQSERSAAPGSQVIDVIILLHGIRTRAFWYDDAKPLLSTLAGTAVRPLGYGYFNVLHFLFPFFWRRGPEKVISEKIRDIKTEFDRKGKLIRISVIAHSFGTYTILKILEHENDIDLHNLILCGSVLPVDYRFGSIVRKVKNRIVNDAGARDIWPVAAKICSFGYGESGTFGFYSGVCEDRFHDFAHSDFFRRQFIERYWCSIFSKDIVVPSDYVRSSHPARRIISVLSVLPRGFVPVFLALTGLFYFGYEIDVSSKFCAAFSQLSWCNQLPRDCSQSTDFVNCLLGK